MPSQRSSPWPPWPPRPRGTAGCRHSTGGRPSACRGPRQVGLAEPVRRLDAADGDGHLLLPVSATPPGRKTSSKSSPVAAQPDLRPRQVQASRLPAVRSGDSVPGFRSGEEFSALAGGGTKLVHDLPVLLRTPHRIRRGNSPLLPQPTGRKVGGCSLGPKDGVEVKQCAEYRGLVPAEVGFRPVAIKMTAEQIGVRAGAEDGMSDAERPLVGASAGQQEFADAAADSVLPATSTSQEAVPRSRQPPSKGMPSSVRVISPAARTSSLTDRSRSGPLNRSEPPPSRIYRRPGLTNHRTRSSARGRCQHNAWLRPYARTTSCQRFTQAVSSDR